MTHAEYEKALALMDGLVDDNDNHLLLIELLAGRSIGGKAPVQNLLNSMSA